MTTKYWAVLTGTSEKNEVYTIFCPVIEFIKEGEELIPYVLYNELSGPRVVSTRGVLLKEDELKLTSIFPESELEQRYKNAVTSAYEMDEEEIDEFPLEVYVQSHGINLPEVSLAYRKNEHGEVELFSDFDDFHGLYDRISDCFEAKAIY